MSENALQSLRGVMTTIAPVPTGIDPARLTLWNQRGKFNYESVRSIIGAAIQGVNEERAMAWGDLITLTPDMSVWYMNGGKVEPADVTMGDSRPPLVRGNNAGHMIDLKVWALGFGGTSRRLEDMTESQLIGGVISLATALRDRFDWSILTRATTNTENALGTGFDVGWCDGSPGTVIYAPPKWNGTTFFEDHNHYLGYNTSGMTFDDAISGAAFKVAEHGLPLNTAFKVLYSETDVVTYRGLTNMVKPVDNVNVVLGGRTDQPTLYTGGVPGSIPASGGRYTGLYNTAYGFAELYATPRIPTGYGLVYRPGQTFAADNGIAIRYRLSTGFGIRITEVPDYTTTFPIKEIDCEDEYGVSCGKNRYAGAVYELVSGGTFTNPTISL